MKMNNIILESGKEYTLSQLFSGENKIIIPDLQRDYCWGDKAWDKDKKNHTELVSHFIENLIDSYKNAPSDKLTLGLIYGYEQPKRHIQLCDGQQRITTLFLLLGMINRKTKSFQKYLISDFELNEDDKEPYLQYAIRESTLYFLSDLVCEFFLKKEEISIEEIKKQDWYFAEYDLDASIVSMIEAIKRIEEKLAGISEQELKKFGDFIVNNLQMLYYDMGNRTRGEETFVVINTTGEPLTATENLKPKIISCLPQEKQAAAAEEWEKWDCYFWNKRSQENMISDVGFNEFLRWISIIKSPEKKAKNILTNGSYDFEIDDSSFDFIKNYFEKLKWLFDEILKEKEYQMWLSPKANSDGKHIITQIDCLILLPLIEYVKLFGNNNETAIFRLKRFLENLIRLDNVKKAINDIVPMAVDMVRQLNDKGYEDIAEITRLEKISTTILTAEEKLKFELYLDENQNRESLENKFWEAEAHEVFNGEIMSLITWATINREFNAELFDNYWKVFNTLLHDECDYPELDITRRALIVQKLKDYPRIFNGYTNYSFCWEYSDWKTLISDNVDKFGLFLKELFDKEDIYAAQKEMFKNFPSNENWAEFVENKELLEYCGQKKIQRHGDLGWALIAKHKATTYANLKAYKLYLDLRKEQWSNWQIDFYPHGDTCAFFDFKKNETAIDVFYRGNGKFILQLFRRNGKEIKNYFSSIVSSFELSFDGRYNSQPKSRDEIISLLRTIMKEVEKLL